MVGFIWFVRIVPSCSNNTVPTQSLIQHLSQKKQATHSLRSQLLHRHNTHPNLKSLQQGHFCGHVSRLLWLEIVEILYQLNTAGDYCKPLFQSDGLCNSAWRVCEHDPCSDCTIFMHIGTMFGGCTSCPPWKTSPRLPLSQSTTHRNSRYFPLSGCVDL